MRTRDPNEQRGKYRKLLGMSKRKHPKFYVDDYGQTNLGKRPKKVKKKAY